MVRLALLIFLGLLAACGRPPNIVGVETAVPVETVPGVTKHRVYIATPRAPSDDPSELFSGRRGPILNFAAVDVFIPPAHEPGKVERPRSLPPDPRKHFVVGTPQRFTDRQSFQTSVARTARSLPDGDGNVLVFVHGYNTTLSDAVLNLAQFVEDSGYDGVPVLFSWASGGQTVKYVYDINSALVARDSLVSMMSLMDRTDVKSYDVVAHSMGTFLVMEAGRQIAMTTGLNPVGKARNVVLAAPDIDVDLFVTQIRRFPERYRRFVVLVSRDDKALRASRRVAGGVGRVGAAPVEELAKLGVNAIDLSEIDDESSLSHSKFKDSPEIAQLMGNALVNSSSFNSGQEFSVGRTVRSGRDGVARVLAGGG